MSVEIVVFIFLLLGALAPGIALILGAIRESRLERYDEGEP